MKRKKKENVNISPRRGVSEYVTRVHVVCAHAHRFRNDKIRASRIGFPDVYACTQYECFIRAANPISPAPSAPFRARIYGQFCSSARRRPNPLPERNRIPFYSKDGIHAIYIYYTHTYIVAYRLGWVTNDQGKIWSRGKNRFH